MWVCRYFMQGARLITLDQAVPWSDGRKSTVLHSSFIRYYKSALSRSVYGSTCLYSKEETQTKEVRYDTRTKGTWSVYPNPTHPLLLVWKLPPPPPTHQCDPTLKCTPNIHETTRQYNERGKEAPNAVSKRYYCDCTRWSYFFQELCCVLTLL